MTDIANVTTAYAPIFALTFVVLSVRTLLLRRSLKVGVGDGDHVNLRRAIRAHSNFAEYTPIALLLIFFLEISGASAVRIHVLCVLLIAGRVVHALAVSREPEPIKFRVLGMALTFTTIISAAVHLLVIRLL